MKQMLVGAFDSLAEGCRFKLASDSRLFRFFIIFFAPMMKEAEVFPPLVGVNLLPRISAYFSLYYTV